MNRRNAWCCLAFSLVVAVNANAVKADLPASRNITISIRETPTDPTSPVTFAITLQLVADHSVGNSVAWAAASATFDKFGPEVEQWVEESPAFDTADGFWWIEHNDPLNPEAGDFKVPPRIIGLAVAQDEGNDDLVYDFEGSSNPATPPPSNVSAARFYLRKLNAVEPEEESEEDEEPVIVEDTTN